MRQHTQQIAAAQVQTAWTLRQIADCACLHLPAGNSRHWYGSISVRNGETAFFDFDLRPSALLSHQFEGRPPLIGRGWVERSADNQVAALVLVCRDSRNGLGFVARVQGQAQ